MAGLHPANAGFGISPPYVKSDRLIPGSYYEQKITLLRSAADENLQAVISIEAPEIASWISIDKGEQFDLPAGKLQVPMIVRVDVPDNAEIDNYKVAGDWLFYINLLEIGNIYFCSKSLNYHRRHEDSIVKTVNNKIHFNEIVAIQNYISNKYDLSKEISNKVQLYRTIVKKYLKV